MKGKFPVCMNRTSGQSSQIDENLNCHNKGDNGNSYRDFIGGQNDWEKCWHWVETRDPRYPAKYSP